MSTPITRSSRIATEDILYLSRNAPASTVAGWAFRTLIAALQPMANSAAMVAALKKGTCTNKAAQECRKSNAGCGRYVLRTGGIGLHLSRLALGKAQWSKANPLAKDHIISRPEKTRILRQDNRLSSIENR
jgi:hypothetical protein